MRTRNTTWTQKAIIAAITMAISASTSLADIGVSVVFDDPSNQGAVYHDAIERLLIAAVGEWTQYVEGDATLTIQVRFDRADGVLMYAAAATSVYRYSTSGVSVYDWCVAHEIRTGIDINGSAVDATITVNPDFFDSFYFDPDAVLSTDTVPAGQYDAFSVLVHEFGHTIAFNGWLTDDSSSPIPGMLDDDGHPVPPVQTSRVYLVDEKTKAIKCAKAVTDPFARLAPMSGYISLFDEFVDDASGSVRFIGTKSQSVVSGGVELDSGSHYHTADRDSVMHTFAYPGVREYLRAAELAVLEDLGLPMSDALPSSDDLDDPCLVDSDEDGSDDCTDECPFNPDLTQIGECGCLVCEEPIEDPGTDSTTDPTITDPVENDPTTTDPTTTDPVEDDPSDDEVLGEMPEIPTPSCGAAPAIAPMLMIGCIAACLHTRRRQ